MKRKIEQSNPPSTDIVAGAMDVVLAYHTVFGSQEGKIVLADLMRHFGYTLQSTMPADGNLNVMARNEGSRVVLIHIGRRLETDPASVEATQKTEN